MSRVGMRTRVTRVPRGGGSRDPIMTPDMMVMARMVRTVRMVSTVWM